MQHTVLRSLLEICRQHTMVQIIVPETRERYQTMMIGFDLETKEILLAGMYPAPQIHLLHQLQDHELWLQSRVGSEYLKIKVKPLQYLTHGELLSVELIHAEMSQNRRWQNRASFSSGYGPEIALFIHRSASKKSHILNLSAEGLCIECYGHDLRHDLRSHTQLDVCIKFNDHFSLNTKINIKQCSFRRTPCCHSLVRATFEHTNTLAHHQLQDFVMHCAESNQHIMTIDSNTLSHDEVA